MVTPNRVRTEESSIPRHCSTQVTYSPKVKNMELVNEPSNSLDMVNIILMMNSMYHGPMVTVWMMLAKMPRIIITAKMPPQVGKPR